MPDDRTPPSRAVRGLAVPWILYGTAWKEERTRACVRRALAAGYRGLDTANQRRHYVEAEVGAAVQEAMAAGETTRQALFLQTKFTYAAGQDHRLPFDASAPVPRQVEQSMASSLEHLGTDRVDSYVLHGPASGYGWSGADDEAWAAMVGLRDAGKTRLLGVSNVSRRHLDQLAAGGRELPAFVQNRCFARLGWDRAVRAFCAEHDIAYQGFSLLTANPEVLGSREVRAIAARAGGTPAQVIFAFARAVGMFPLTGTTDPEHLREDLASAAMELRPEEVALLESLAG
jgi:diketogulonate reductase-like aldo/keto reductase